MSSLAIPAAPPPPAANPGSSAAPAADDGQFGDTLRQTQSAPQPQADGHPADDQAAATRHAKPAPDTDKQDPAQADDHPKRDPDAPNPLPAMVPIVPMAPAPVRQASTADGKALPATARPAAAVKGAATAISVDNTITPAITPTARPPTDTAMGQLPADAQPGTASDASPAEAQMPTPEAAIQTDPGSAKGAASPHSSPSDFTTQLTQLVAAHVAPPASNQTPAPVQLAMQVTPAPTPQFAQETAQHVAWLVGQGIQKADIQLNPGKLGPIHVEIATHHDRVDVTFAVQHPQTVNALQQTLPQLQHMLAQQGLNLGQASVGQQSPGQQHAAFAQHPGAGGGTAHAEPEPAPVWRSLRVATPGRVDDFA